MLKKIFLILFVSFNCCISQDVVIQNKTDIDTGSLYWNYAVVIKSNNQIIGLKDFTPLNARGILIKRNIETKRNIIRKLNSQYRLNLQIDDVNEIFFVEIRLIRSQRFTEPYLQIPLAYNYIKIFNNNGIWNYEVSLCRDNCCSSCIVS